MTFLERVSFHLENLLRKSELQELKTIEQVDDTQLNMFREAVFDISHPEVTPLQVAKALEYDILQQELEWMAPMQKQDSYGSLEEIVNGSKTSLRMLKSVVQPNAACIQYLGHVASDEFREGDDI